MRPIEFDILLTLAAGEQHGYAIIRAIETRSGITVETGTLYRALQRLVEDDFVRHATAAASEDARRQVYSITARGRKAAVGEARRMSSLVDAARAVRLIGGNHVSEPWWSRAYRMALTAFPREFRSRWESDMRFTFAERMADAQRKPGGASRFLILREIVSTLAAGLTERFHLRNRSIRMIYVQDIRYAFRLLARSPGFALLTVLVLAGGLGLSTFTFSFLHTAMIRAIPLDEGDRIVRLMQADGDNRRPVDVVDVQQLSASMHTVRTLGGYMQTDALVGREDDSRRAAVTLTEPVMFTVARAPAFLGRTLVSTDAEPGAEPVIVLAYQFWEVAFGANRAVLNTLVPINGVSTRIVGVMPEHFGFPVTQDAWLPLSKSVSASTIAGRDFVQLFARLAPAASHEQAAAEATALLHHSMSARDTAGRDAIRTAIAVESFPAAQIGEERAIVFAALNLLAGMILLLALVNVTTLLTARANERIRETAVRLALGASTGRLIMQGMWEAIILCIGGGIVGTAASAWGLDAITAWTRAHMDGNLAFWWVWEMDRVTLMSAGAFVTVAIAVLGSVVSVRATRTNVREVMQDGSARSGSRREGRLARNLVVAQVTTVTVLMFIGVMSGVMTRSLLTMDHGYDPTKTLQATIEPSQDRFATAAARGSVYRDVQARLSENAALDGVVLRRRLADRGSDRGAFATRTTQSRTLPSAHILATLGDISTMGVKFVDGRLLDGSDDVSHTPVVMISRSLAARNWPGRSPVGDQIRLAAVSDTAQWRTIVGVVSDVPYGNPLSRDRGPEAIYLPLQQSGVTDADVVVRYRTSESAGRQALRDAFARADPLQAPAIIYRATELLEKVSLIITGLTKLFGSCFAFALLLAVAGTYGLMSRSIGMRTREIGVRRALGASDATTAWMLLTQGAQQLGVGTMVAAPILVTIGIFATQYFSVGRVLTAAIALGVSAAIIGVVLAATWLPTRKVLRVPLRDALWKD